MPTPRERLLLIFEAEHPETGDPAVKDEAIRRTFGLDPQQYRALVAEVERREGQRPGHPERQNHAHAA